MKKTALGLTILVVVCLLTGLSVRAVEAAPHLTMSPATGSYSVDDTFKVTVKVDSGTEKVGGVDGVGTYDSAKLELVSSVKASPMVFDTNGGGCSIDNSVAAGKFSFSCYSNDALSDSTVNGDLVVLTFKAKATGTAVAAFTCSSGSTTDSNIVKSSTATDVIVCGENKGGSYDISEGSGGEEDTSADEDTATPTVAGTSSELPKTGGVGTTLGLIIFGVVSLASAVFLKFL